MLARITVRRYKSPPSIMKPDSLIFASRLFQHSVAAGAGGHCSSSLEDSLEGCPLHLGSCICWLLVQCDGMEKKMQATYVTIGGFVSVAAGTPKQGPSKPKFKPGTVWPGQWERAISMFRTAYSYVWLGRSGCDFLFVAAYRTWRRF